MEMYHHIYKYYLSIWQRKRFSNTCIAKHSKGISNISKTRIEKAWTNAVCADIYHTSHNLYTKTIFVFRSNYSKDNCIISGKNITIDIQSLNSTSDLNITKVEPGGWYKPLDCQARHRVAVIVPYRNREANLYIFMRYIHPYLQRHQLDYRIFLVEQVFLFSI